LRDQTLIFGKKGGKQWGSLIKEKKGLCPSTGKNDKGEGKQIPRWQSSKPQFKQFEKQGIGTENIKTNWSQTVAQLTKKHAEAQDGGKTLGNGKIEKGQTKLIAPNLLEKRFNEPKKIFKI